MHITFINRNHSQPQLGYMYVCLCHPFSDKKVKEHLSAGQGKSTVAKTYSACSGGENPNCCQCLETLKDIVKTHNKQVNNPVSA